MSNSAKTVDITCIRCPVGCVITVGVDDEGNAEYREGATCARGREYAVAEATQPVRSVATIIAVAGCGEPLSVKTTCPIPKTLMSQAVAEIKQVHPSLPIEVGEVVLKDVCHTGIDVVATKSLG